MASTLHLTVAATIAVHLMLAVVVDAVGVVSKEPPRPPPPRVSLVDIDVSQLRPPPRPLVPIAVAPDAVRSPYAVEIVGDGGDVMDTFFHKSRYYVRGAANRAYAIRITNPTAQRVEAVISVDGLDVIDGENGDTHKRGYIVPPYGSVTIDGWRTSLENVAAFRFSSVKASYAGRKGKARNVGVIAVAIFNEEAGPMIVA